MRNPVCNYEELSDADLARCAGAGDSLAIRQIVKVNNRRLFRAAWSVLRHSADAEDVVQETYLKAFGSIGDYRGVSSLSTWLTRIALNTAVDRLRQRERRRQHLVTQDVALMEDFRSAIVVQAASPEAHLAQQELRRVLTDAIASLPEDYRIIFVLRDIEGLSTAEAAEAADIPEATVKTRLFRARQQLRASLATEFTALVSDVLPFAGVDCAALTDRVLSVLSRAEQPLPNKLQPGEIE